MNKELAKAYGLMQAARQALSSADHEVMCYMSTSEAAEYEAILQSLQAFMRKVANRAGI